MRKSLLLARANIKKAKSQTVVIFLLILIAAIMLNLWLMLSIDYKQNFKRSHDRLNAEHVTLMLSESGSEFRSFVSDAIESDERTDSYEMTDALGTSLKFQYNDSPSISSASAVILSKTIADNKTIGQIEFLETKSYDSGIYLPIIYKSDDIYTGSTITMEIGNSTKEYTVCGFINSIMLGSQNCSMEEFVFTDDKYDELNDLDVAKSTLCSIRLDNPMDGKRFLVNLKKALSDNYVDSVLVSNVYEVVSQSRYISQSICSALICIIAFLTLLISAVVIISNISNYIHESLKNLGALKAIGFTSIQLISSLVTQFLSITVVSAVLGTGISYLIYPALSDMMSAQTGIPYKIRFLPLTAILSLLILVLAVALAVIISARKLRTIEPITALRSGIKTHSFMRNHIPLDKAGLPVNISLAFKTTISNMKQNVVTAMTMLVISLLAVFTCIMYENVIVDMVGMLNLIVGEYSDGFVSVSSSSEQEYISFMENDERVENNYYYDALIVSYNDTELSINSYEDADMLSNKGVIYEGRFPKYENEVAVNGKFAKKNGLKIGDEITLSVGGREEKYIITGFDQLANYLGYDGIMTREGSERIFPDSKRFGYYFNVINDADIDDVISELDEKFGSENIATINQLELLESSAGVYVTLMTVIVVAVVIISLIIITFVLYLLVKSLLNAKMQDYGILKSIGYTTRQIVVQTALSFMPSIIISTVIGITVSCFVVNPLMGIFLSSIGIVKCTFTVPYLLSAIAGVFIIASSFGIVCLLSRRVRKIAPRELLINE